MNIVSKRRIKRNKSKRSIRSSDILQTFLKITVIIFKILNLKYSNQYLAQHRSTIYL